MDLLVDNFRKHFAASESERQSSSSSSSSSNSFFLKNNNSDSLYSDLEHAVFNVLAPEEILLARANHELYQRQQSNTDNNNANNNESSSASSQLLSNCVQNTFVEAIIVGNNNTANNTNIVSCDSLRAVSGIVSSFHSNNNTNNNNTNNRTFISRLPNNSFLVTPACVVVSFWRDRTSAQAFVDDLEGIHNTLVLATRTSLSTTTTKKNNNKHENSNNTMNINNNNWLQSLAPLTRLFVISGTGIFATAIHLPPIRHRLFSIHDKSIVVDDEETEQQQQQKQSEKDISGNIDSVEFANINSVDLSLPLEMKSWKESVNEIFNNCYKTMSKHSETGGDDQTNDQRPSMTLVDVFLHPHSFSIADGCEGIPVLIRPSKEMIQLSRTTTTGTTLPKTGDDVDNIDNDNSNNIIFLFSRRLSQIASVIHDEYLLSNSFQQRLDSEANTFNRRRTWEWLREKLTNEVVKVLEKEIILLLLSFSTSSTSSATTKTLKEMMIALLRELGLFLHFDENDQNIVLSLDPLLLSSTSKSSSTTTTSHHHHHPKLDVVKPNRDNDQDHHRNAAICDNNNNNIESRSQHQQHQEEMKEEDNSKKNNIINNNIFSSWHEFWIAFRNEDPSVAPLHIIDLKLLLSNKNEKDNENIEGSDHHDAERNNHNEDEEEKEENNEEFLPLIQYHRKRRMIEDSILKFVWEGGNDIEEDFFHRRGNEKAEEEDKDNHLHLHQSGGGCAYCSALEYRRQENDDSSDSDQRTEESKKCGWVTFFSLAQDYLTNQLSNTSSSSSNNQKQNQQLRCGREWAALAHCFIDFVINEIQLVRYYSSKNHSSSNNSNKKITLTALHGSLYGVAIRLLLWTPSLFQHSHHQSSSSPSSSGSAASSLTAALLPCFFHYYSSSVQHKISTYFLDIFIPDECNRRMLTTSNDFVLEEELVISKKLKQQENKEQQQEEVDQRRKADGKKRTRRKSVVSIVDIDSNDDDSDENDIAEEGNIDNSTSSTSQQRQQQILLQHRPPSSTQTAEHITIAISSIVHHLEDFFLFQQNNNNNNQHHHLLISRLQRSIILPLAYSCLKSALGAPNILFSEELANILAFKYCPLVAKQVSEEVGKRLHVVRKKGDLFHQQQQQNSSFSSPKKSTSSFMSLLYSSSLLLNIPSSSSSDENNDNNNDNNNSVNDNEIRRDLMFLLLTSGFATLSLLCPSFDYRSMVKPSHLYLKSNPHSFRESNGEVIVCASRLRRMLWKIFHLIVLAKNDQNDDDDSVVDDEDFFYLFETGGYKQFFAQNNSGNSNDDSSTASTRRRQKLHQFIERRKFTLVFEDLPLLILSSSIALQNYQLRQQSTTTFSFASSSSSSRSTKEKALYFIMDHVAGNYAQSSTGRCLTAAARRIQRLVRSRAEFRMNVALLRRKREFCQMLKEESVSSRVIMWKIDRQQQNNNNNNNNNNNDDNNSSVVPSSSPSSSSSSFVSKKRSLMMMIAMNRSPNKANAATADGDGGDESFVTSSASSSSSSALNKRDQEDFDLLKTFVDEETGEILCPALKERMEKRLTQLLLLSNNENDNHKSSENKKLEGGWFSSSSSTLSADRISIMTNFHEIMADAERQQIEHDRLSNEAKFDEIKKNQSMILEQRKMRRRRQLMQEQRHQHHLQNMDNHDTDEHDDHANATSTIAAGTTKTGNINSSSRQPTHHEVKNEIPNTRESLSARRRREVQHGLQQKQQDTNDEQKEKSNNNNDNKNKFEFFYPTSTRTDQFEELEDVIEIPYEDRCAMKIQCCWRCFVARTDLRLMMLQNMYFSHVRPTVGGTINN